MGCCVPDYRGQARKNLSQMFLCLLFAGRHYVISLTHSVSGENCYSGRERVWMRAPQVRNPQTEQQEQEIRHDRLKWIKFQYLYRILLLVLSNWRKKQHQPSTTGAWVPLTRSKNGKVLILYSLHVAFFISWTINRQTIRVFNLLHCLIKNNYYYLDKCAENSFHSHTCPHSIFGRDKWLFIVCSQFVKLKLNVTIFSFIQFVCFEFLYWIDFLSGSKRAVDSRADSVDEWTLFY